MSKILEILNSNNSIATDIENHPSIQNNFVGLLKNIESNIPEDCRQNFYANLESLRIVACDYSACSINAPVIYVNEKLLLLADNNRVGDNIDFLDVLLEELYHELLHLASTNYIVDIEESLVRGYSGFLSDSNDFDSSNELFNGLTEGFTQYLTETCMGSNYTNYDTQIECIKKLIDIVGIDTVKQCYFNNNLGMQPIVDKLFEKGLDVSFISDLESMCHVDLVTHLVATENSLENNPQSR